MRLSFLEDLAQDVEDAAIEGFVDRFQLGEQAVINLALAGFLGDEVPEMADLLLADAVDAAEALFQAVRVPRQVVVHHQIGVLEVHAFTRGISGQQDADFRIGAEHFLAFAPFVAMHAAVDGGDGVGGAKHAADPPFQIVQGVLVLGEEDHLALTPVGIAHVGIVLEDLGKLVPFAVHA